MKNTVNEFNKLAIEYFPYIKARYVYLDNKFYSSKIIAIVPFLLADKYIQKILGSKWNNCFYFMILKNLSNGIVDSKVFKNWFINFNKLKESDKKKIILVNEKLEKDDLLKFAFFQEITWKITIDIMEYYQNTTSIIHDVMFKILKGIKCPVKSIVDLLGDFKSKAIAYHIYDDSDLDDYIKLFESGLKVTYRVENKLFLNFINNEVTEFLRTHDKYDLSHFNYQYGPQLVLHNPSSYFIILTDNVHLDNGTIIKSKDGFTVWMLDGEFPIFENKEAIDELDLKLGDEFELKVDTHVNNDNVFKSLLPVSKKHIALFLLTNSLKGNIAGNYINGGITHKRITEYIGDYKFRTTAEISPSIQYVNRQSEGTLL